MSEQCKQVIIEISVERAVVLQMRQRVTKVTGDSNPFFCPPVQEGKAYVGHAHTFPPFVAKNISTTKIRL